MTLSIWSPIQSARTIFNAAVVGFAVVGAFALWNAPSVLSGVARQSFGNTSAGQLLHKMAKKVGLTETDPVTVDAAKCGQPGTKTPIKSYKTGDGQDVTIICEVPATTTTKTAPVPAPAS